MITHTHHEDQSERETQNMSQLLFTASSLSIAYQGDPAELGESFAIRHSLDGRHWARDSQNQNVPLDVFD